MLAPRVIHPVNQDPRERAVVAVHRMTDVAVTEAAMAVTEVAEAAMVVIEACSVTVTEGVAASKLLIEN
jgi:hypothetical protein